MKIKDIVMPEQRKNAVAETCESLLEANDGILRKTGCDYAKGYNDALVRVMKNLNIPTDRTYVGNKST